MTSTKLSTGDRVRFVPGVPPYARNKDTTFIVTSQYVDNTGEEPRPVAWLVNADDTDRSPSRQRIRSAYLDALVLVDDDDDDDDRIDPHADGCPFDNGSSGWCTCTGN